MKIVGGLVCAVSYPRRYKPPLPIANTRRPAQPSEVNNEVVVARALFQIVQLT